MLGISPTHRFHLQYLTQLHTKPSIMKTHPQRQKKELLHLKKAIGIESSCNAGILITNTSNNAPKPHQVFEVLPMTYRKLVYDSNPSNMQASREKIVIRIGFYTESARRKEERERERERVPSTITELERGRVMETERACGKRKQKS